jgi:hypothetical protein
MKSNQSDKSNRKSYDCTQAVEAMRYVAKVYRDLPLSAYAIYQTMPILEADKFGFGKQVCCGLREIAALAHMSVRTVKPALMELNRVGLLRVELGQKSKRGEATKLQRVPISEVKAQTLVGESIHSQLGRALTQKGVWLNGARVFPTWEVRKTNRLYSSKPNVQGLKKKTRMEQLIKGAPEGSVLVSCDFKAADPTVIKALLKFPPTFDPYATVMRLTGWDKATAKIETNKLAYCADTAYTLTTWPANAQHDSELREYGKRLVRCKKLLSEHAQKERIVKTLTGNVIKLPKRTRPHGGKLLNWVVQGTVADVTTMAGLELVKREDVSSLLYLHDEMIVLFEPCGKTNDALQSKVEEEMLRAGQKCGIAFQVSSQAKGGVSGESRGTAIVSISR